MTFIRLICCLLALSSSAFGRSTYGSFPSTSPNSFPTVGGMRDLVGQQKPFLGQISTPNQLPVQNGYGQQSTGVSSGLTSDIQQDTTIPVQRPLSTFSTGFSSSFGTQDIPRKQMFMQNEQPVFGVQDIPRKQMFMQNEQSLIGMQQPMMGLQMRDMKSPLQLLAEQQRLLQDKIQTTQVLTEADNLCRDQRPETVIPLDEGRRFIVCLDNGKGVEQQCPKGLHYQPDSRRCERRVNGDPCASQPCLNGGQCLRTDVSSFQCQCVSGFDGLTCELDSRVCQTQQPCGQSPDTKCQSFRWGAALQYICILQDGRAYGLNVQQAQQNPCQGVDGPQPLAITDKGFVMCDGERMFIESCPGGTVWDDLNKACVWPDMQGLVNLPSTGAAADQIDIPKSGYSGYGQQTSSDQLRPLTVQPSISAPIRNLQRPVFDQSKVISQFGSQSFLERPSVEQQRPISQFGSQSFLERPSVEQTRPVSQFGLQGSLEQSFNQRPLVQQPFVQQGLVQKPLVQQPFSQQGFVQQGLVQQDQKQEFQFPQDQQTLGFGGQQKLPVLPQTVSEGQTSLFGTPNREILRPQIWQQPIQTGQPIQRQQDVRPIQQQPTAY